MLIPTHRLQLLSLSALWGVPAQAGLRNVKGARRHPHGAQGKEQEETSLIICVLLLRNLKLRHLPILSRLDEEYLTCIHSLPFRLKPPMFTYLYKGRTFLT